MPKGAAGTDHTVALRSIHRREPASGGGKRQDCFVSLLFRRQTDRSAEELRKKRFRE